MSTYAYHAIQSESASRLQVGRYSLRVAEGSEGRALLIVSNGTIEQTFDLSSFIATPFDPSGTLVPYPYPGDSGIIIDTTTLYEAMRLMAEFIVGFHNASETSFSSLSSKTSGFNANGTELTVTKLNGYRTYDSVGGNNGALPGHAPWIVGVKEDGVAEVGRILDFHTNYTTGTLDATCRLTCTGPSALSVHHLAVTGTLSGPTITSLTTRVTNEETKSTSLRTDLDAITLRVTDEETKSTTLRTDVDAITLRVTEEETKSTTLRTDVDAITLRVTDEETKSTSLRTDVNGLTSRMSTAEGTLASHSSLINSASASAAAVNAKVTRIMGTYYYPNGYDDPSNKDFRTIEWVVDYMLKNVIPSLGELETSNTLQSWLIGIFGVVDVADLAYTYAKVKQIEGILAGNSAQLIAHEMALEAHGLLMAELESRTVATAGSVVSILALTAGLTGGIVLAISTMINRSNGPMKEIPREEGGYKPVPITADTDPVALIGYTDPIARIINDVSYEVADARLIKFEGDDARIDPTLRVDTIIVSTLNGVDPSEYALASSLANYATVSSLSNYVTGVNFVNTLYNYATNNKVDNLSARVTVIETDYALASSLSNYALVSALSNYATVSSLSSYVTESFLASSLVGFALESSLSQYAPLTLLSNYALTSSLSNYATTSSLSTLAGRVTTVETKTTSLSYTSSATTISNALRLPMGQSIDPSNSIVYYGTNVRIEKWWVAPWSTNAYDALILIDHVNTAAYGNEVRMLCGRIDLFRHPGAWSHGVYIDVHLIHFGTETVPQIANINYVSYNVDGTEPHAREPRLALVTHTASSKQYLAIHVPFYVTSGRVHFSGIMSTMSESIPMTMCLPGDGYTIDQSPYDVWSKKQEWNHGLRCIGDIDAPNITTMNSSISSLAGLVSSLTSKTNGLNVDGTEITVSKINGLAASDYITDGALQFLLNGYVPLGTLSDYATTSSLSTLAGRVTTVETKTSRLSYTSALDLLTVSSSVTLSKTLSVGGTAGDSISITCPNGKIMATNVTVTNKDDIDALNLKTSGLSTDGTELTVAKLNGVSVSDYAKTMDVGNVISSMLLLDTKTSGLSADGTELTVTKLNGYAFYDNTIGSGIPAAPWIPGVKTDGVMEVGRMIDFHTDYASGGTDQTCRVTCTGNSLSIPNISVPGSVSVTGTVTGSNITTMNTKITTLETKTTGLSYSSGTIVFDTVPKIGNESMIDFFYPVGSIYTTSVSTFNPNTKWGGTWVKIEGRVLYGSNSTRSVGDTGGNEKVTIESRHLPDHTHPYEAYSVSFEDAKIYNSVMDTTRVFASSASTFVRNTSGWKSVSTVDQLDILPPYEVVNIWKRTA